MFLRWLSKRPSAPRVWPERATAVSQPSSIVLQLVTFTDGTKAYCAQRSGKLGYGLTEIQAYRALFDALEAQREINIKKDLAHFGR